MSTAPIFRKTSRAEQVAEGLRTSIRNGVWKRHLPPERILCEQAGTSRPTLRQAVHLLEKEGLVRTRAGALTEILAGPRTFRRAGRPPARVMLLTGTPTYAMSQKAMATLDIIRQEFARRGCTYDFLLDPRIGRSNPGPTLKRLTDQYAADCWILASVPQAVQVWFQAHHIRAVVLGSTFPGIQMSSVDTDHGAVTRHAVGACARLGHHRLAYLQRHRWTAGEDLAVTGLREALAGRRERTCVMAPHAGNLRTLHARLAEMFRRPRPPTAILVSHALDTLAVIIWLLREGLRVPQDVSVLTLQYEDILTILSPASSHYELKSRRIAASICRVVLSKSQEAVRLLPAFVSGGTLAAPGR